MTPFRRAGIDRRTATVEVEVGRGTVYFLPGRYDPDNVLSRVIAARSVDLTRWEKANEH